MNNYIENQLAEIAEKIRVWDPEENSVETLLNLCNEYSKLSGMNVNDWVNVIQFGCATKYEERVARYSQYPIWACDLEGNCIIGTDSWDIEHIADIDGGLD